MINCIYLFRNYIGIYSIDIHRDNNINHLLHPRTAHSPDLHVKERRNQAYLQQKSLEENIKRSPKVRGQTT